MTLNRKAVSPLIATIILIAVTLAIAFIVIAWIYGIFGTATGPTEKLQVFQDARLVTNGTHTMFNVTLKNIGTSTVSIAKVYVKENATCVATPSTTSSLNVGDVKQLTTLFSCALVPGVSYNVIIVTGGGSSYSVPVTVEQGTISTTLQSGITLS